MPYTIKNRGDNKVPLVGMLGIRWSELHAIICLSISRTIGCSGISRISMKQQAMSSNNNADGTIKYLESTTI